MRLSLPVRLFAVSTIFLWTILLIVLAVTGILARESILDQATRDVELLADVIERTIERDARLPDDVERLVSADMATTAMTIAEWVASIEGGQSANANRLRPQIKALVARSNIDEVWVTDAQGHAYLSSVDNVDFTFSASAQEQPQASEFYPLLRGDASVVIQAAQKREIDDAWFKYVGVQGADTSRIVQVGRDAGDINAFRELVGLSDLVRSLISQASIKAIYIVDENLKPLRGDDANMMGLSGFTKRDRNFMQRMLSSGETLTEISDETVNVASPISAAGELVNGAFYVALSRDGLDQLLSRILYISALLFVAVGLLSAAASYAVARHFAVPIWELTKAATAVQRGNYKHAQRLKVDEADVSELSRLAGVFRDMASKVALREQELDALVQQRTEEITEKNVLLEHSQTVIEEQLHLAQALQQATLPLVFPSPMEGLTGAASMEPALQVGGDFYDSFAISESQVGVVLADVSGKGVAAAFFAAMAKNAIREVATRESSPATCLTEVNQVLIAQNPIFLFVTLNYAVIDVKQRSMTLASAGHPSPFICGGSGRVEAIKISPQPALGIIPDTTYQETTVSLRPSDAIVFYSDGITEAENALNQEFTEERFAACLAALPTDNPEELLKSVFQQVAKHANGAPQSDDITLAVVTLTNQ